MKIGFLASHRGSNMQSVVDACREGALAAVPAVLVSNNRNADVVSQTKHQGIATYVLNAATHPDPDELDQAMFKVLQQHGCELIVLAGFMRKIGPRVLRAFVGRIINIHPSLLPKHGGRGMYGRRVHEAVLAAGDAETGVTIHLVDGEYDEGRVLAQCEVPVLKDDTADVLAARVLEREHTFLVETLREIVAGRISLEG